MSDLSNILRTLMNEVGITVTELARQTDVGQPVIHRMASGETDNPKVGSLSPIAKFFNVSISHLIGDEPLPTDRVSGSHNPYYRSWSKLPLLNMEQATLWPQQKIFETEIATYVSTEANVSENAFAIRLEDNTMEPRFPAGTILIIEPNLQPTNNDFAAVNIKGQGKVQFKQVQFDGEELYLKALNPDFETKRVTESYHFCGVMVQALAEYYQDRLPQRETPLFMHKPPVKKRKEKEASEA